MEKTLNALSLADFTPDELTQLGQQAWTTKKKEIHDKGIPTTKVVGDNLYYEYPDGHLELLETLSESVSPTNK